MKKKLIITVVTLFHLGLILLIARSCGDQSSSDQADDAPPPPPKGEEPARTAETAPELTLPSIPFSYLPRQLPPELMSRQNSCRTGVLIDWEKQEILWRKEAEKAVPIASMTKMMTTLLLVEAIKADPALSLSTQIQVSKAASLIGGSQVYLDPRESLSIDDLLKCVMMFSANDAAYQIAEYLGDGQVSAFVEKMNSRAKRLGLSKAAFHTPHGLTDPATGRADQATAMELAFLGAKLLQQPDVVKWTSTRLSYIRENSAKFKPFQLVNRNKLITSCPGVNGMKTGYTAKAGFCVTATCERGGRVLIAVVTGCPSSQARNDLVKALFDWGYSQN
ncbi:MAG: D-alanyl-D-alanine carboxypeptidase family protein [Lentisphaeria bacterium]|nr:D-alanyl-D-alanine carboxypeptidase family protein [Lentisphaeria bacterium]